VVRVAQRWPLHLHLVFVATIVILKIEAPGWRFL
jgi:hypothetical protein